MKSRNSDYGSYCNSPTDNIKYQSWGLDVSEYLLMISTISALIVVLLHSHRLVILRRIWLLLGILYYYRALTMFVTVLPKADETYTCMPRKNDTTTVQLVGSCCIPWYTVQDGG